MYIIFTIFNSVYEVKKDGRRGAVGRASDLW